MIRKIVLTNFMAHAHTELELGDGLNVLVGPNNIGKSTIAVALRTLARNSNSAFVLQHDRKECSVQVETSEGHTIQWLKRKSPSYVINGVTKDRLGRGNTPKELDETLRLAPVEFEDKDFEPHFGEQKSPIFLIDRSPSQIAQFFSTTSDAEKLVAMQRLHQRERADAKAKFDHLSEQNRGLEEKLEALSPVPDLERAFQELELSYRTIQSLAHEIEALKILIHQMADLVLTQQVEELRNQSLDSLRPPPGLHSVEPLESIVAQWEDSQERLESSRQVSQALKSLEPAPSLADTAYLSDYIDRFDHAQSQVAYWFAIQSNVESLEPLPVLEPTEAAESLIIAIESATREHERYQQQWATLQHLTAPPTASETQSLNQVVDSLTIQVQHMDTASDLLQRMDGELAELDKDIQRWLASEPTCSACGAKLSQDAIRFRAHTHGIASNVPS